MPEQRYATTPLSTDNGQRIRSLGSGFRGEYQTQVDEELPIVNARAPYTLLISDQSIHYLVARLGYDRLITWSNDRLAAFNNDLLTTCRNSQAEVPHLIWPVRVASDSIYGEVPDPPSEVSGVRENASEIEDFYQRIGCARGLSRVVRLKNRSVISG